MFDATSARTTSILSSSSSKGREFTEINVGKELIKNSSASDASTGNSMNLHIHLLLLQMFRDKINANGESKTYCGGTS